MRSRALSHRAAAVAVVVALSLIERSAGADSSVQTAFVHYQSPGSGENGFQGGVVEVGYKFATCAGQLALLYSIRPSTLSLADSYQFEGNVYASQHYPQPRVTSVRFAGQAMNGGSVMASFTLNADDLGMGCFGGNSHAIGPLSRFVKKNATPAEIQEFFNNLSVTVNQAPVLRDYNIEQTIKRELADAEKKKQEKEKAEKAAKEKAEKEAQAAKEKAEKEAKEKEEQEAKEKEEQAAREKEAQDKAEQDAANKDNAAKDGEDKGDDTSSSGGGGSPGGIVLADSDDDSSGDGSGSSDSSSDGDSSGSGDSSSGDSSSGDSSSGSSSSGSSSSGGGAGAAAGAGGAAAAGLAAAAGGGGDSSTGGGGGGSEPEPDPRGPSTFVPIMGTLGGLVLGWTGALTVNAWNKALSTRLDAMATRWDSACKAGNGAACTARDDLRGKLAATARNENDWGLDDLLGPTIGYSAGIGYVRERHAGQADPDFPLGLDGTLSGLAVELAFRFRAMRFELGYQHVRGNLLGSREDYAIPYNFSETQGVDSLSVGAAAQVGFHHLLAPYAGFKFRKDFQSGHFDDVTPLDGAREHELRGLSGGRTLLTLGVSLNLAAGHKKLMAMGPSLNLELYRSLSPVGETTLDSGFLVTMGYAASVAPWVSELEGMTSVSKAAETSRFNLMMPYVFIGGAGLQLGVREKGHVALSIADAWFSPNGSSGIAFAGVGPVFPLTPDGLHAAGVRISGLAFQYSSAIEDGMDVGRYAFGTITPYYRALIRNHTAELSIKFPIVWMRHVGETTSWFGGAPPVLLAAGFGY
jgi:hypothetical protein